MLALVAACSAYRGGRTLFRPREEYEYLRLLNQVAAGVETAAVTARQTAEAKLGTNSLRSRQRATLSRMVSVLPQLQLQLVRLLLLVLRGLLHRDMLHQDRNGYVVWRRVLQCVENIASQATSSRNKWDLVQHHLNTLKGLMQSGTM